MLLNVAYKIRIVYPVPPVPPTLLSKIVSQILTSLAGLKTAENSKMEEAKFELRELLGVGFTIIVLGIGIAYGLDVLVDVEDDLTANANASQAVNDSINAVAEITDKLPTIATVIVASVIIGILVTYLWARFAR